jgi:alpha-beta hydrolase superfamily lysophospholipase
MPHITRLVRRSIDESGGSACPPKPWRRRKLETKNSKLETKIVFAFLLSLTLSSCVTLHEENFFMPENKGPLPAEAGVIAEDITIESGGNTLSGVIVKNDSRDYLLFFYGNGQSIYETKERLYYMSREYNLNVVCFDYRGYGKSTGKPSFDSLMSDAGEIYSFVTKTYKPKRLYMFSQSVGTVPCAYLGSSKKFDGIIMEAGFTSAKEAVPRLNEGAPFPPIKYWVKLTADDALLNRKPQPVDFIKDFKAPLLYLHGTADTVFPQDIGQRLFAAAGSKDKVFCSLPGVGHSNVDLTLSPAKEAIDGFFKKYK